MLPFHRIESIFDREHSTASSEVDDLEVALRSIKTWNLEQDLGFEASFSDQAKTKSINELTSKLIKESGLIARLKRYLKKEPWNEQAHLRQVSKALINHKPINMSDYESVREFATAAVAELDSREVSSVTGRGAESIKRNSISIRPDIDRYSVSLDLYRMADGSLRIAVSLVSSQAFENEALQASGYSYLAGLASNSQFERSTGET